MVWWYRNIGGGGIAILVGVVWNGIAISRYRWGWYGMASRYRWGWYGVASRYRDIGGGGMGWHRDIAISVGVVSRYQCVAMSVGFDIGGGGIAIPHRDTAGVHLFCRA